MPATHTIERIAFDIPVSTEQVITVAHKVATQPDSNFVIDTTTQAVGTDGVLNPALVITGLAYDTYYTVRVSNSCGDGRVAYETFKTGVNPCPDIAHVYGTVN